MSYALCLVPPNGLCLPCQDYNFSTASYTELTVEEFINEEPDRSDADELRYFEFETKAERDTFIKNVQNLRNFIKGRTFGEKDLADFLKIYPELLLDITC